MKKWHYQKRSQKTRKTRLKLGCVHRKKEIYTQSDSATATKETSLNKNAGMESLGDIKAKERIRKRKKKAYGKI